MDDLLKEAQEAFDLAAEAENENRTRGLEDLRFARMGEQWPQEIINQRQIDQRPVMTFNRLPTFIRQVVNDARQMKPSIKVHPADSKADPETAEIINGLLRNIEYTSNADVAYDTATECAVTMGWGYFTIDLDYAHDDTFDLDIRINRVANPLSIYGDPNSQAADSSDWNTAFQTEWLTNDAFTMQFPDADPVDWEADRSGKEEWFRQDEVMVAKWWRREQVRKTILLLSDGSTLAEENYANAIEYFGSRCIVPVNERDVLAYKVKRHLLTGKEVLETEDWSGQYIPIVPVYGDEVNEEGKRHLLSLIHFAKDPQRNYNYWRTTASELVALAPRVPFIGPKGAFKSDARNWATANTTSHPYLEYDPVQGAGPPQRQPLDTGAAAGALQEAMNSADDMKATIGLYDASLGARSNETSGRAIVARQREGDTATFHFQDNMARAIRHAGRILIDMIPKVYTNDRVIRVLGEDGEPSTAPLNRPVPVEDQAGNPVMEPVMGPDGRPVMGPDGQPAQQPVTRIYDLSLGKYDLTVSTGPSYNTMRQEAATQMMEMVRAFPAAAPLMGDLIAKNLDWPGADEIAKRLKSTLPPNLQEEGGLPPQVQAMIKQGQQVIQGLTKENEELKADKSIETQKLQLEAFNAQTDRMKVQGDLQKVTGQAPEPPNPFEIMVNIAKAERDQASANHSNAQAEAINLRTRQEALNGVVMPLGY